jgi:ribosomal protein S18 acetylase RimI-like enzyme
VIGAPHIEEATSADIAALARLRHQFDWSNSLDLLGAIQQWRGGRLFVIREGALVAVSGEAASHVAVATAAIAAPPVGVIGSVIVRPEFQRGGLGRVIMEHALAWLAHEGVRHVFLDATPAGRPLYRRLGFVDVASSWYTRSPQSALDLNGLRALARQGEVERVTTASKEGLERIAALDRQAFGGDRIGLLGQLLRQPDHALLIAEAANGAPLGYLMTRPPEPPLEGVRVGPLVASDNATAAALLEGVLEREGAPEDRILGANLAGDNPRALALFRTVGAATIEDDLIMRLDLPGATGATDSEASVGDGKNHVGRPSGYCWIAPMVF